MTPEQLYDTLRKIQEPKGYEFNKDKPWVLGILRDKPPLLHLVLTGRDAHPAVVELADTVSEVLEVKHAYQRGIEPQPGIDY